MARRKHSCTIDGTDYESESVASKSLGVNFGKLQYRLTSPNFPEYISKYKPKKTSKQIFCSVAGIQYKTALSATKDLGISHYELKRRLASFDYPDYVRDKIPKQLPTSRRRKYPCKVNGVRYESVLSAVRDLGISDYEMRRRLASFHYPDYLCDKIPKKSFKSRRKKYPCMVNGVHYESEGVAAKALRINATMVRTRIQSPKFPEYVSKHRPKVPLTISIPCHVVGVQYESIEAAANDLGISYDEMKRRLISLDYPGYISDIPKVPKRIKKSLQQKLHSSLHTKNQAHSHKKKHGNSTGTDCIINGVRYESEKDAARALGVYITTLQIRLYSPDFPEYVSKYKRKIRFIQRIPCNVAGVEYKSVLSASKELGISHNEMRRRLASADYPDYISPRISKKPR